MTEIRREQFSHGGRAYAVVVTDDGRHVRAVATAGGRAIRRTQIDLPPRDASVGLADAVVDGLIDDVKRRLIALRPAPAARRV
jgi:hypothetical protein